MGQIHQYEKKMEREIKGGKKELHERREGWGFLIQGERDQ